MGGEEEKGVRYTGGLVFVGRNFQVLIQKWNQSV